MCCEVMESTVVKGGRWVGIEETEEGVWCIVRLESLVELEREEARVTTEGRGAEEG